MTVPHSGQPPLYRQVYAALREGIDAGRYKPGERLPTEPVLAAGLGVHRLTVRRAIEELAREGYLQARQGAGTFVTRLQAPIAVTIPLTRQEFASSLRAMLEAQGQRYVDRLLSTQLADDPAARHELGAVRSRLRRVDSVLEVDGESWVCSTAWGRDRVLRDVETRWRETDGIYGVLLDHASDPLRYVWRSFSAEPANAADAGRLGIRPGTPVLVREGLTADAVGKPVLWVRRRARYDRVRYVLEYDAPAAT
jgi:GntR family transcriptional regulator